MNFNFLMNNSLITIFKIVIIKFLDNLNNLNIDNF